MRRYLYIAALAFALPLVSFVGINWLIDPYRIFHRPWIRDNYYPNDKNMRIEAAGIINSEEFDSLILGTSIAANFSAKEATRALGGEFVNISMDGSSIAERAIALNYALRKKKIKKVILSLDGISTSLTAIADTPIGPYLFLYDDCLINDIRIYASDFKILRYALVRNVFFDNTSNITKVLSRNVREDLETIVEWKSVADYERRFGGLSKWLEAKNDGQVKESLESILHSIETIRDGRVEPINTGAIAVTRAKNQKLFNDNLTNLISRYKDTYFVLFFPPYSRLSYAIAAQSNPTEFQNYLEIIRFVVAECSKYPNVRVFGFDTEGFLDEIANYRDTVHYHKRYNSAMLYWISNGMNVLTQLNVDDYINEITVLARKYELRDTGNKINSYFRENP